MLDEVPPGISTFSQGLLGGLRCYTNVELILFVQKCHSLQASMVVTFIGTIILEGVCVFIVFHSCLLMTNSK